MEPQILVDSLRKVYRVHERESGAKASVASLFRRKYREVQAVESVSFNIQAGEVVGFLGPNGAGLSIFSIYRLSLTIGPEQAAAFTITLAASVGIVYFFWLFLVTLTFWVVRIDNLEQIVAQAFEAGRYPIDIYPGWLRGGLTYVVPVVFMITVPARALAGRTHGPQVLMSVVIAVCAVTLTSWFWRFGLKNYTGASA